MHIHPYAIITSLTAALAIAGRSPAQAAVQLGDLDPNAAVTSSTPIEFAEGGGKLYCSALTGFGRELIAIDYTTRAVTVFDIAVGSSWSEPQSFLWHAGRLWFSAIQGVNGRQLFSTDGTQPGTSPIVLPGTGQASNASDITAFGNHVVFAASDGLTGKEPWIVDTNGTNPRRLADIEPGFGPSDPSEFTLFQGLLHFRACSSPFGCALWRTDGTPAGTVRVLASPAATNVSDLAIVNGQLLLQESLASTVGLELFSLNGTSLTLLADTRPGTIGGGRFDLRAIIGNRAVFQGNNALWTTDGTAPGTRIVTALAPRPDALIPVGTRALFWRFGSTELWITDGSSTGTSRLLDLNPGGTTQLNHGDYARLPGGRVVFSVQNQANVKQLWVSDGTASGTFALATFTGVQAVQPAFFFESAATGTVFFSATSPLVGTEVWQTDGTIAGTAVFANLAGDTPLGSQPLDACDLMAQTVFSATTETTGRELWITDGEAPGTQLLADIELGPSASDPAEMTRIGNRVLFAATTAATGRELWVFDQAASSVQLLFDLEQGSASSNPHSLSVVGDEIWFTASDPAPRIWRTDGTAAGTRPVDTGITNIIGLDFTAMGNSVYFVRAVRDVFGSLEPDELWVTDGTASGTRLVKDIFPGTQTCAFPFGGPCYNIAGPRDLVAWNDRLWFTAIDGVTGRKLWVSDGTPNGTVLGIDPNSTGSVGDMILFGDRLWFASRNTSTGDSELWTSDGTTLGTAQFLDIRAGTAPSSPANFARLGSRTLLFTANDGVHGREVWMTDGTLSGTRLAVDIAPGLASSAPQILRRNADDHASLGHFGGAFVVANDGLTGSEPWILRVGATATPIGPGRSAPNSIEPTMATGDPVLGLPVTIRGVAPPGAAAVVALGAPASSIVSFFDLPLYVSLLTPVQTLAVLPPAASWQTSLTVPNDPTIAGLRFVLQTITAPSSAGVGFDVSNGVAWVVGS